MFEVSVETHLGFQGGLSDERESREVVFFLFKEKKKSEGGNLKS